MNVHSLRTRLFLTIAGACVIVALSVAMLSRRAASREFTTIFDGAGPPVPFNGDVGELHRLERGEELPPELRLHKEAQHSFDRSLLLAILVVAGAAVIGTAVLTVWIVRPIERLTRSAADMRRSVSGAGARSMEIEAKGEVGELARTLSALAADVERTEDLRKKLMHDVGHELRTPLTALRGQVEAMQDGLLQVTPDSLQALHANLMHLGHIVEDLQEIALAEAGELRLECEPLDLAREVESLLASLEFGPASGQVTLVSEIGAQPLVRADRARLRQVLTNLLDNAVTHSPADGSVRIRAREIDGAVEISVHDQGTGIAPADLPHVFERFYRADPARDRRRGGVGLGLAIARQLLEAQGGTIRVESEPGVGTTFRFTLPRA